MESEATDVCPSESLTSTVILLIFAAAMTTGVLDPSSVPSNAFVALLKVNRAELSEPCDMRSSSKQEMSNASAASGTATLVTFGELALVVATLGLGVIKGDWLETDLGGREDVSGGRLAVLDCGSAEDLVCVEVGSSDEVRTARPLTLEFSPLAPP